MADITLMANPMTTQDDIIVGGASGAAGRLAKGSDGQVLRVSPTTHHLEWASPSSGAVATDALWDAAGDLAVGSGADTAARLAIGNAGALLARINGAVAWNAGTSFPTATTGDRYFRTDLGVEFYYDGTRWVSLTLVREFIGNASVTVTGVQSFRLSTTQETGFTLYLVALYASTFTATTSNGSNKYAIDLQKLDSANSASTIVSFDTGSDTADTWTRHRVAIGATLDPATNAALRINATKTGTPGSCTCAFSLGYRYVTT